MSKIKKLHGFTHGQRVTCKIRDMYIKDAVVSIGNFHRSTELFICQNEHSGAPAPEKFGYKYSYVVSEGTTVFQSLKAVDEIPGEEDEKDVVRYMVYLKDDRADCFMVADDKEEAEGVVRAFGCARGKYEAKVLEISGEFSVDWETDEINWD